MAIYLPTSFLTISDDLYSPVSSVTTSYEYIYPDPSRPGQTFSVTKQAETTYVAPISSYATVYNLPQYESSVGSNPYAQRQMAEYLTNRFLDKWIYEDDYKSILKYLKSTDGKISLVESESEYTNNSIKNDTISVLESKVDYINDNYFDIQVARRIITKIIEGSGNILKWYNLSHRTEEEIVMREFKKYLKRKLSNGWK